MKSTIDWLTSAGNDIDDNDDGDDDGDDDYDQDDMTCCHLIDTGAILTQIDYGLSSINISKQNYG